MPGSALASAVVLLVAAAAAADTDCGAVRAANCYSCVKDLRAKEKVGVKVRGNEWFKACQGDCRWSVSLQRCIIRKKRAAGQQAKVASSPAPRRTPAAPEPSAPKPKTRSLKELRELLATVKKPAAAAPASAPPVDRLAAARSRISRLKSDLRGLRVLSGRPPRPAQYLLVGFIEQQLASATSLGLHQVLRTAYALNRTAVLPRARFDEPSYRTTLQDGYFPVARFYDRTELFAPWSCAHTTSYVRFLKDSVKRKQAGEISNEIDLVVIVDPKRPASAGVQRNCDPKLLADINTARRRDVFRRGVDKMSKVVDTIGGVATVGDVVCVPQAAKVLELREAFADARAVMLLTPDDHFLALPWSAVCRGIPDHVRFKPKLAQEWDDLGATLTSARFGRRPFACIHVRMEKLIRQAYLAKRIEWKWKANATVEAPYLDRCLKNMELVMQGSVEDGGLRSRTARFLITDMQADYGSVTEHVDTKEDLMAYRAWLPAAERRLRLHGDEGFCGTKQHRRLVEAEEKAPTGGPAGMLLRNPRACAWAEATICRRAPAIFRFGGGSFSNFATAERGKHYESCEAIAKAASNFIE